MRYVTIPEDINLVHPRTKEPSSDKKTFIDVAYDIWFNDPKGNAEGPLGLRRWMKMVDAFDASHQPGSVVALEESDFAVLKSVVEKPTASYQPLIAIQMDAFAKAILDAPSKDPRGEDTKPHKKNK